MMDQLMNNNNNNVFVLSQVGNYINKNIRLQIDYYTLFDFNLNI